MFKEALLEIQNVLNQVDYQSTFLEKSNLVEVDSLLITLKSDEKGRERFVSCHFFPTDEEVISLSHLLQWFTQVRLPDKMEDTIELYKFISLLNSRLPVGLFYVEKGFLNFRNILVISAETPTASDAFLELFKMFIAIFESYAPAIEEFITNKSSSDAVMRKLGLSS